jgi:hypothetical protein
LGDAHFPPSPELQQTLSHYERALHGLRPAATVMALQQHLPRESR